MTIPPQLKAKFVERISVLVDRGNQLLHPSQSVPGRLANDIPPLGSQAARGHGPRRASPAPQSEPDFDRTTIEAWKLNVQTISAQILPASHRGHDLVLLMGKSHNEAALETGLALLMGIKDDFENDFFDKMAEKVQSEIASNYMGQAEGLLGEGIPGHWDYVPAAVLAGAVLENNLRVLCGRHQPPIPTMIQRHGKDEPKTMHPLIDDLAREGVITPAKAAILKGHATIRNHAAHGEFDKFTKGEVENMIAGIKTFLGDVM